jgi:hypothetical protein
MAVVSLAGGETVDVALSVLPKGTREGSVLRVPVDERGSLRWEAAALDEAERRRRLDEARRTLEQLKRRDPGGDLTL